MGNCDSRKFPPVGTDVSWRHCGQYNDWQTPGPNFCTPLNGNHNDVKQCNEMGGESEWKLRTPVHRTSRESFVNGGIGSPEALQAVIPQTGPIHTQIQNDGESLYNTVVEDIGKAIRGKFVNTVPGSTSNMGPLYGPAEIGTGTVPLWSGWINQYSGDEFPKCHYNDWRKNGVQSTGCCSKGYTSCGIMDGMNVVCLRDNFAANATDNGDFSCCFNDLVCESGMNSASELFASPGEDGTNPTWGQADKCFLSGDSDDMRTCKPESRNLGGNFCRDKIEPYCDGTKLFPGQTHWTQAWDLDSNINVNEGDIYKGVERPVMVKGACAKLLMRQVSGLNACDANFATYNVETGTSNIDGVIWAQQLLKKVFTKYIQEYGSPINNVNEDGIDASLGVNNFLFNICSKFPAFCENSLTELCSQVTEERISQNPIVNKWCGCYMPEEQYTDYTQSYLISKECTPFCSRTGVIPAVNDRYEKLYCQDDICVMNKIYLSFLKTEGAISFDQVCNNCGPNVNKTTINGSTTKSFTTVDTSKTTNTGGVTSGSVTSLDPLAKIDPLTKLPFDAADSLADELGGSTTSTTETMSTQDIFNTTSSTSNQTIATSCHCALDNISLEFLNTNFNNINFQQQCGGLTCNDDDGSVIPCSGTKTPFKGINSTIESVQKEKETAIFRKITGGSFGLLILIAIIFFFTRKKKIF